MKSKKIVVLIILIISFFTTSCSPYLGSGTGFPPKSDMKTEKNEQFVALEESMNDQDISYEKKENSKEANRLGAMCGATYEIYDGSIEIYSFDPESKEYAKAAFDRYIEREDKSGNMEQVPVAAFDGVVVIIHDIEKKDDIVNIMKLISDQWLGQGWRR